MDPFQKDQEAIALRQQIEQQFANRPDILDKLRANADIFDSEIRSLPEGTSPDTAINHLASQNWFSASDSPSPAATEDVSPEAFTQEQESPRSVEYFPPKEFATHLPPLSHTEVMVVFGRIVGAIDNRYWEIAAEDFENPQIKAIANYGTGHLWLTCWAVTTLDTDPSLYASFSDARGWTVANEQIVGETMRSIHQALTELLDPPAGVKLWVLRGGQWETGVYFDS